MMNPLLVSYCNIQVYMMPCALRNAKIIPVLLTCTGPHVVFQIVSCVTGADVRANVVEAVVLTAPICSITLIYI